MSYFNILLLFSGALTGGLSVFLFKNDSQQKLKLILSFSGAYLFAITVLHLLPDVYTDGNKTVGLFILLGFIFQIVLEQFSEGVEHGHVHKHVKHNEVVFPYGIIISLSLHAFLEGMPLSGDSHNSLVYGIAIHHIPAAFALASILLQNNISGVKTVVLLVVFALMSPMGYIFSNQLSMGNFGDLSHYYTSIMGIVIGIFLHISTTILFESTVDHKFTIKKTMAVAMGISIALLGYFLGY
ncbi:MAG: zinc/iron permease [Sphingobacteriales bacterium]|nr:MAG: zinc/iron permease [Sphingobacteriales bacterium]TAF81760.1 MAG: zinc/iron permease [Sphingobacteriales bacterium]